MRTFHFVSLLISLLFVSCDAHDYWALSHSLSVNSEENILYSETEDPVEQDLFVRYQLDYEITNKSNAQASEVVVSATSYVNSVERITGSKVWHLNPNETVQGILTTSQLQLGNSLVVSLSGCAESRCSRKDVLCPETTEDLPDSSEIATFCYDACSNTETCIHSCPAESSCKEYCHDSSDENCRQINCGYGGNVSSCPHVCKDDTECLQTCEYTPECINSCISLSATCFRNCIATWTQCTESTYESDAQKLPCALCNGEGLCSFDFDTTEKEFHTLIGDNGTEYTCDFDCRIYPASCVSGCNELYSEDSERMSCLDLCLRQYMFWCNDYSIPRDYVDSSGQQPCCFESFCQAELTGVVKSYEVECFNDTECGSGSSCSPEGLCVSSGASSCSTNPQTKRPIPYLFLFLLPILFIMRRKGENQ